jgi:formate hydrogenlyase subunit 6/NADH:ubiquinone oxidoreductase subunit I
MERFRPTEKDIEYFRKCAAEKRENNGKPTQIPWILVTVCEGCGDCVEVCVGKGIQMVNLDKKVPNAWVLKPDNCIGCGYCATYCIAGAIQMTTYVDWALEKYLKTKGGPYPSRFAK